MIGILSCILRRGLRSSLPGADFSEHSAPKTCVWLEFWPGRPQNPDIEKAFPNVRLVEHRRAAAGRPQIRGVSMRTVGKFLIVISALFFAGQLFSAGLPSVESDYAINGYEVLMVVHQLLFVFWLGPDIGVYAWSRKVINPELTPDQRLAAANVMHTIDIMPRVCLSLMLTVGGILTEAVGLEHPLWQLAGIILLGPVWLTIVLVAYIKEGTALGATVNRLDLWLRWALFAGVIVSVAYSTSTGRLDVAPWVGWKLLLFAAVISSASCFDCACGRFLADWKNSRRTDCRMR